MAIVIDADTHVVESEAMWEFFDEEHRHLKPVLVGTPEPATGRLRNRWVIGARLIPQPAGFGGHNAQAPPASPEDLANPFWGSKSLQDIPYRLNAADEMGVDVQVIYPTLFIVYLTGDPEIELGMCRAYNRFMADVWVRSNGRMRWVVVPPLLSIDATLEELHYGVEHGAVGVMFRGMEGSRSISDPYFFPVYEEAARLNLPVCIHTGAGNPTVSQAFDTRVVQSFPQQRLLPLVGFHDLVLHRVPERFPDLRVGFIETSASWVPYLLHYLKHRVKDGLRPVGRRRPRGIPDIRRLRGRRGRVLSGRVHPSGPDHDRVRLWPHRPLLELLHRRRAAVARDARPRARGEDPHRQPRPVLRDIGQGGPPIRSWDPSTGSGRTDWDGVNQRASLEDEGTMAREYNVISGDGHIDLNPDAWRDRVAAKWRDRAPKRVAMPNGMDAIQVDGGHPHTIGLTRNVGYEKTDDLAVKVPTFDNGFGGGPPEQRLREQDEDGLDAEVLFSQLTPVLRDAKGDDLFLDLVRAYNEFLGEEYQAADPDRLIPMGLLPTTGVDDAIREMEHCAAVGLRGVKLDAFPTGLSYPTPDDDRFWAVAVAMRMPLTSHSDGRLGLERRGPSFQYEKEPGTGHGAPGGPLHLLLPLHQRLDEGHDPDGVRRRVGPLPGAPDILGRDNDRLVRVRHLADRRALRPVHGPHPRQLGPASP